MYTFILLMLALMPIASFAATTSCNADNCLRAVRATPLKGSTDCSSYLRATVTPKTVTITQTSYAATTPASSTITSYTTVTSTPPVVTSTVLETSTVTPDVITDLTTTTTTATSTVYTCMPAGAGAKRRGIDRPAGPLVDSIEAREIINDRAQPGPEVLAARQQTVRPMNIPAYASACSGAVRYSSACSCIGVTATTTTVIAPTSTTTLSSTTGAPTPVITTTITTISTLVASTTTTTQTIATTLTPSYTTSTITETATTTLYPIYELNTVGTLNSQPIDIIFSIDRLTQCGPNGSGFMITSICGTFAGNTVTYNPTDAGPNDADQCLYVNSAEFVSLGGVNFRIGADSSDRVNLYFQDGVLKIFDEGDLVSDDEFRNAAELENLTCDNPRAVCVFTT